MQHRIGHKANQISICGANWCKYSWTHHRVIDGLHYSWLVLGKTLTTYPWHIIHICLIFQWPNKKNRPKRRQENAKKCDKNFLISARKKPSRPQNQKFCILKNITRQEIVFWGRVMFLDFLSSYFLCKFGFFREDNQSYRLK